MKNDRQNRLRQLLLQEKKVSGTDLARRLGVSPATVRRDLTALAKEGLIKRRYGTAELLFPREANIPAWEGRSITCFAEKRQLAQRTVELIPDHCTVFLDGGTTVYEVARYLTERKDLTVVTCALRVAGLLGMQPDLQVYCIGGKVKPDMLATSGMMATEGLAVLPQFDIAVFSTDAFSAERGLVEYSMEVAMLKRHILKKTDRLFAVADHRKFRAEACASTCGFEQVDTLITDAVIPEDDHRILEEKGVTVETVMIHADSTV